MVTRISTGMISLASRHLSDAPALNVLNCKRGRVNANQQAMQRATVYDRVAGRFWRTTGHGVHVNPSLGNSDTHRVFLLKEYRRSSNHHSSMQHPTLDHPASHYPTTSQLNPSSTPTLPLALHHTPSSLPPHHPYPHIPGILPEPAVGLTGLSAARRKWTAAVTFPSGIAYRLRGRSRCIGFATGCFRCCICSSASRTLWLVVVVALFPYG